MNVIPFLRLTSHLSRNAQLSDLGQVASGWHPYPLYMGTGLVPPSLNMPAIPHLA